MRSPRYRSRLIGLERPVPNQTAPQRPGDAASDACYLACYLVGSEEILT